MPRDLYLALQDGHEIEAHNVAFERSLWMNIMVPRYDWILPEDEQWRDTMAVACYYALPAALDKLAYVLGFEGKDPEGGRLITKYSKLYLKTAKKDIPQEDFDKFVSYCVKDVQIEQSVSDFLGDLPERELPVFQLDQKMNLRGLCLDLPAIKAATKIVNQRNEELTSEFEELVGLRPSQTAKILDWATENGVPLDNLQAAYLQEVLDDDLPSGPVRRALEIRLEINKASTKKLDAMARQCGKDGRARFQTRYHGAVTGRPTGSGFQPLNLNRGFDGVLPEQLVRDIRTGDPEWLDMLYGNATDAIAKASRHFIMAEPGNKIIAGDFVSIEAVILACLAGEEWKVEAFRNKESIYEKTADKIYKFPPGTVTKETHPTERHDGKTCELAFGYQGALGAWLKFDSSGRHTDERIIEFCKSWREDHPMIVKFWSDLNWAAISAVDNGKLHSVGQIAFEVVDDWLTMILPSGKRLWYWKPDLRLRRPRWCKPLSDPECASGKCGHQPELVLYYMAQKTGQWKRVHTYGGKLAENACQATSREILVPALFRAEEMGYNTILTVYDEIVTEVPEDFGSAGEFAKIMEGPLPDWAKDWPVRVEAWEGQRYRK